jgi:hypothetical protein
MKGQITHSIKHPKTNPPLNPAPFWNQPLKLPRVTEVAMEGVVPKALPLASGNPLQDASLKKTDTDGREEGPPAMASSSKTSSRCLWSVMLFAVIVIVAAAAVLLTRGDDSDSPSEDGTGAPGSGTISPTRERTTNAPTISPVERSSLTRCPKNQLCQLVYDTELVRPRRLAAPVIGETPPPTISDSAVMVGRSYDSNDWEASAIAVGTGVPSLTFGCSTGSYCYVEIPTSLKGSFYIVARERERATTPKEQVSRFLNQATFGATWQEVNSFPSTPHAWVAQQLTETATSHRAYYRQRVHSPVGLGSPSGRQQKYCEESSRWDNLAIVKADIGKQISFRENVSGLFVDDTMVTNMLDFVPDALRFGGNNSVINSYTICFVFDFAVQFADDCSTVDPNTDDLLFLENPTITFLTPPPAENLLQLSGTSKLLHITETSKMLKLDTNESIECTVGKDFVWAKVGSQYFRHSPRVVLLSNTIASPAVTKAEGDGPSICANVAKSFVNVESCTIHRGTACEALRPPSVSFVLAEVSLRDLYTFAESYVYEVNGLRLNLDSSAHSPCLGTYSRWVKTDVSKCTAPTSVDQDTITTLTLLLSSSQDPNPAMRDIRVPNGAVCQATKASVGVQLAVGDDCWENVHPDLHNVFDFSYWAQENAHPGNAAAAAGGRRNPIKKIAEDNQITLTFPGHHEMSRWVGKRDKLTLIGRLHDTVDFSLLPTNLQTEAMATQLGATIDSSISASRTFGESCGSPNEVANQPSLGHRHMMGVGDIRDVFSQRNLDSSSSVQYAKTSPWTMIAMYGKDQLRQRIAWALSQVLVISLAQLGNQRTEAFHHYYDIFVRHAFGNYRDVLKEVSFSPMMGRYLSYLGSTSFQYQDLEIFPDENFAREIMQLFSIGLYKLNIDGTIVRDVNGQPIQTYTNDDISE